MAIIDGAIGGAAIGSTPIGGGFLGGVSGGSSTASDGVLMRDSVSVTRGRGVALTDTAVWTESFVTTPGAILREHVDIAQLYALSSISHMAVVEQTKLIDRLARGLGATVDEGVTLSLAQDIQRAVSMVESLGLSGTVIAAGVFGKIIEQVVKLRESFTKMVGADVDEAVIMAADLLGIAHWSPTLAEAVVLNATFTPRLIVSVKLADGVDIEPHLLPQLLYSETVHEGIEIELAFVGPAGGITSWSINTRTGVVGEYSNYDFNSFAQIGSIAYGASPNGLYEMLGDTDAGDVIIARLKSGYMQFGGTHLSRLKEAYIAVRSADAKVVMKIVTADDVEYIYQVDTRSMRNTRVNMGKGMRARYFAFELVTEGQDFDLDTLEFVPIVVQRRV